METVTQGDDSSLNIQNDYFNKARKNRTRVTVVLTNGQRISGFIRSFDKFTLILDTRHGDQMVFKHAISTVSPSGAGSDREHREHREHRGPRPSHGESRGAGPGRPHGGPKEGSPRPPQGDTRQRAAASPSGKAFGNFMDLSGVAKSPAPAPPSKKEDAAPPVSEPPKTESAPAPAAASGDAGAESKPAPPEPEAAEGEASKG